VCERRRRHGLCGPAQRDRSEQDDPIRMIPIRRFFCSFLGLAGVSLAAYNASSERSGDLVGL